MAASPLIQFRATEPIGSELKARIEPIDNEQYTAAALSLRAYQDLERYYTLLSASVPMFKFEEVMLLVDALNGTIHEAHSIRLLWAEIADAIKYDKIDEKWAVNGSDLIERLRDLSLGETYALVDAIERIWNSPKPIDMKAIMREYGLVEALKPN